MTSGPVQVEFASLTSEPAGQGHGKGGVRRSALIQRSEL